MTSEAPSPWVVRWASAVPAGGAVLDVACGGGRHSRLLLGRGHPVVAVDVETTAVADLTAEVVTADLEGGQWPLPGRTFAGVVVTRYLHRPLLPTIVASVAPGGVLVYETFNGHGGPRDPAYHLRPGELLDAVRGELRVLAYEDLDLQRICARREAALT